MSSGSSSPSKTTSTQKLDPFIKEKIDENLRYVDSIVDKGYTPYGGQGVAGLNQQVAHNINGMQDLADSGKYQGLLDQAAGITQGVANSSPSQVTAGQADLSQFQNPYTEQVVGGALSDIDRSRQMAVNQTQDQAISSGAFAGNRSALADAATNSEYARQAGNVSGQLRAQGFNTALGAAQNQQQMEMAAQQANQQAGLDQSRLGLLAGGQLGQLGMQGNQMRAGNLQNAINAGLVAQNNHQAQKDFDYQQYLREFDYPMQLANMRTGAIGATPTGGTTTSTAPGGGTNRMAGAMGGAMAGAQMGSMVAPGIGTAIGGGIGLLGGMFG